MKRLVVLVGALMLAMGQVPARAANPPLGWVIIPAIGLYAPVHTAPIVDEYHVIGPGVGHLEGTTWVTDGWGRVVLAAHNPGMFTYVPLLEPGDRIIVVTTARVYQFEVTRRTVIGDDLTWISPTKDFTLTLLTCLDRGVTWMAVDAKEID